jgi:hypothetical protein
MTGVPVLTRRGTARSREAGRRWPLLFAAPVALATMIVGISLAVGDEGAEFVRWHDGTVHGPWRSVFDGHGRNGDRGGVISLRPSAPAAPDRTHAGLVVSRATYGDVTVRVRTRTVRTLRTPAANPWEVSWVVWSYVDDHHFYYVALKPNGWELGKRDPAYPGGQRFLATGEDAYPIGFWYAVEVERRGATHTVRVDGRHLTTFTDRERPHPGGAVGLYTEDAEAEFRDVAIEALDP